MAADIASIAEKHRRAIRFLHNAAFTAIIQLICLGHAVVAKPIVFGDFRQVIVCAFKVTGQVAAVTE